MIGWERQALAVRQALDAQRDAHSAAERMAASASAARASSRRSGLVLAERRPVLDARRGDQMDLGVVAAHRPGAGPDIVGDDPVRALGAAFGRGVLDQFSVSAAKPMTRRGRLGPGLEMVARMSGFSASLSSASTWFCFFSLCGDFVGGAPIGDGGGANGDVGGQRGERRGKHLVRRLDLDHASRRADRAARRGR